MRRVGPLSMGQHIASTLLEQTIDLLYQFLSTAKNRLCQSTRRISAQKCACGSEVVEVSIIDVSRRKYGFNTSCNAVSIRKVTYLERIF